MRRSIIALLLLLCSAPALADDLNHRLLAIRDRLPDFVMRLEQLRRRGDDLSYPQVTLTVLSNFTQMGVDDLKTSVPVGWGFLPVNGADARYEPVNDAHSGAYAAKLVNKTPTAPNVYGMIENS